MDHSEAHSTSRIALPSLDGIPPHTELILRDLIIGLEAEAGTARARALALSHELHDERLRYREHLAGLRTALLQTEELLNAARADRNALMAQLDRPAAPREVPAATSRRSPRRT